jgi:hypothetical protein
VEGCHNFFGNSILTHNCLIIDDPFKNSEEANSETIREKKWDWYRTTAYTRLEPDGAIILVQTRWHEMDLAGHVIQEMKEGGDQWTMLRLPSLSPTNEVWAELTMPAGLAESLGVGDGDQFKSLDGYLQLASV